LLAATNSPRLTDADAIGGVIGTTGQRLGRIGIHMVCNPGGIRLGRKRMQGVFRKAVLLAERRKGGFAGLFVGTWDEAGLRPSRIGTHVAQAVHGFTQQCIVQMASGLKMPAQTLCLLAVDL
jgi:hypothetical protein